MLRSTSKREAVAKLLELGYHPVVVEAENQQKKDAKESIRRFLGRVKTSDLAVFTRQFAALLKAGLPIMAALETLQRQSTNRYLARTIEDVRAS
ncbi:MAG: type II secretion system protein F, partial [Phycisphaeraceae bacterium]|nr:type II secretion system protein F [Phycisphaeraceae bacterium]